MVKPQRSVPYPCGHIYPYGYRVNARVWASKMEQEGPPLQWHEPARDETLPAGEDSAGDPAVDSAGDCDPAVDCDGKQCPWCGRWCLKDDACNYIFACGLDSGQGFVIGAGCGRSWCFQCGKKFCGQYMDPATGQKTTTLGMEHHNEHCCALEAGYRREEYCPGGHNSHCDVR